MVPNFTIMAGPMNAALARSDLLLTVSSTAGVEAIHAGLATGFITDFGVGENVGLPYFLDSGCLVTFDQVDAGAMPQADPLWAERRGLGGRALEGAAAARLESLLSRELTPLRPLYGTGMAPRAAQAIASNHLEPKVARRFALAAARKGYRWAARLAGGLLGR
jgi:hypothetical protein